MNTVVSQKVLKLQRRTIPHFKALDQMFWPLAWLLTLGAMVFEVWSKMPVRIIFAHPLDEEADDENEEARVPRNRNFGDESRGWLILTYVLVENALSRVYLQGDTSKMGQTLRLNPCFNTVPTQLCFQIILLTNAVVCLHWLA